MLKNKKMQFFRREMKIIAKKFAYVKDTLYLCIVKRPTPPTPPVREGGGLREMEKLLHKMKNTAY